MGMGRGGGVMIKSINYGEMGGVTNFVLRERKKYCVFGNTLAIANLPHSLANVCIQTRKTSRLQLTD